MGPTIFPSVPTGYELNPRRGFFSVIVPQAADNIVTNSSGETDANGYIALATGTVARSSDRARRGAYSIRYTPGVNPQDGMYYPFDGTYTVSGNRPARLTAGQVYGVSCDFWGARGVLYEFYLENSIASARIGQMQVRGTGDWERLEFLAVAGAAAGGGTQHRLYWRKVDSDSTAPFYVDGVQVEPGSVVTTYLDGDQVGLVPGQVAYRWAGQPHNSASSRSAQTRAGGRVLRLDELGFRVLAYTGLSMTPTANLATPLALGSGSTYQTSRTNDRPFALVGAFGGATFAQKQRAQTAVLQTLVPDGASIRQPLILRYQATECDRALGAPVDLACLYAGGLDGNTDNLFQERSAISFVAYQPYALEDGETAVSTEAVIRQLNNNFIMQRTATGDWGGLDLTGFDGPVYALALGADGSVYAGGDFSTAYNGALAVTVNNVARWDGTEWSDLDLGVNGIVWALAVAADGTLYAGGEFTTAGAVPLAVDYVAAWDGSAWSALGTPPGLDSNVYALAIDATGTVYAGGAFAFTGAGAAASKIARWNGTTWSAMGLGFVDSVRAIAVAPDGTTIFAAGEFTLAGFTTVNHIARWTDAAGWLALGATPGTDGNVYALCWLPDGSLVAGGNFTTAGGESLSCIARWDGNVWSGLGAGIPTAADVLALAYEPRYGQLWAGGNMTDAGTVALIDGLAGWNGSAWFVPDVDLKRTAGPAEAYSFLAPGDGSLTVGFSPEADNGVAPILLTPNNRGTADAFPRIFLSGTGDIYQIINYTTGDAIFFDNLTLLSGERIILDLSAQQKTMTSSARGNLLAKILPGSALSTWRLMPGVNRISILRPFAAVQVDIVWRNTYHGVEGAIARSAS
jgi:hypothetical protein